MVIDTNGYVGININPTTCLHVSGTTIINNATTLLSELNISDFSTLNHNVSLISSLNDSGFSTFDINTTLLSSLNVSGNTNISNNLVINGTISFAYVGFNYNSSLYQ
jgi:hypothetical protein